MIKVLSTTGESLRLLVVGVCSPRVRSQNREIIKVDHQADLIWGCGLLGEWLSLGYRLTPECSNPDETGRIQKIDLICWALDTFWTFAIVHHQLSTTNRLPCLWLVQSIPVIICRVLT